MYFSREETRAFCYFLFYFQTLRTVSKFRFQCRANLSKSVNFYFHLDHFFDPRPSGAPIKSPFSVRLFVCLSVCLVCLTVSPSVRQFGIFRTVVDSRNIWKLTEPFFTEKFFFAQIWAKRAQNGPKLSLFRIYEKFCDFVICHCFSWK